MLRLRWSGAGGLARKAPPSRRRSASARVALVALAMLALSQEGCSMLRSVGSGCSPCGTGLRLPRIFRHKSAADCGPGCGGEVGALPMEGSAPVMGAPATIAPSAPAGEPDIKPIDPAPTSGSAPKADSTTGTSTKKSDYQAYRPSRRTTPLARRGGGPVRGLPTLEPTPRSAPERSVATLDDPLENLPAPEAAAESMPDSPPAPSLPVAKPKPDPSPPPAVVEPVSPPSQVEPNAGAAPGIARFYGVEPQLAGGSFPAAGGWAWLAEKSYRTVLDLREPGQMGAQRPGRDRPRRTSATSPCPSRPEGINADLLKRFDRELAQSDARPLYFCDADGTRPAALWYLHRVVTEKADRQAARREAEALAPIDRGLRPGRRDLARIPRTAQGRPPHRNQAAPPPVDASEPRPPSAIAPPRRGPSAATAARSPSPHSTPPHGGRTGRSRWRAGRPARVLGRSGLGHLPVKRASLPAPRRSPRSLPPSSGA